MACGPDHEDGATDVRAGSRGPPRPPEAVTAVTAPAAEAVAALVAAIDPVDARLVELARAHHDHLTKPRGSLGAIEDLGARLCAIAGHVPPPVPEPAAVAVFAADHGVVAEGVTPWPQEVTAQMVANFCAGGAAINVIARRHRLEVVVVDVGVAGPLDLPVDVPLLRRRVRAGTANLRREPAMSPDEAARAVLVGADVAAALVASGARALVTGEMGIGNTTASAAVIAALTGAAPAAVTGRGTGVDDATLARKVAVVADALARCGPPAEPLAVLAEVGGLEIAALAGFCLAGARARVPVIVDGVIALAGALVAVALAPPAVDYLVAGHRSSEPGASVALARLGLDPVVDLGLRLGEGSGAALALPVVQAAAAVMGEMATFDGAGVTYKDR
jgi:nicotinate-nucleotide--dimethylbenzimidazole phosphoribosyltransferase